MDNYRYLGFPITAHGINFEAHLERQLQRTVARTSFMARHSASWGTAVRLQTYRQYLAPVIEYGAPLVWAWASREPSRWAKANTQWKELIQWIANSKHSWRLSQNLLGLPALEDRFKCLHMTFLFSLQHADLTNPLRDLVFYLNLYKGFQSALRKSKLLTV